MSILAIVGLVLLLIAIVVGIKNGEYRTGAFWFLTLIGVAVAASMGSIAFLGT